MRPGVFGFLDIFSFFKKTDKSCQCGDVDWVSSVRTRMSLDGFAGLDMAIALASTKKHVYVTFGVGDMISATVLHGRDVYATENTMWIMYMKCKWRWKYASKTRRSIFVRSHHVVGHHFADRGSSRLVVMDAIKTPCCILNINPPHLSYFKTSNPTQRPEIFHPTQG